MLKSLTLLKIYIGCTVVFFLILAGAYYYTDPTASKNLLNIEVVPSFNHIFLNNVKVALLLIFLAPLTLGFGTIIILVINALVLGSFCGSIKNDLNLIVLVLPHGIIEVPILILAASVGYKLFLDLIQKKFKGMFFLNYLLIIIIGLLIAACIETFVTPIFLKGVY